LSRSNAELFPESSSCLEHMRETDWSVPLAHLPAPTSFIKGPLGRLAASILLDESQHPAVDAEPSLLVGASAANYAPVLLGSPQNKVRLHGAEMSVGGVDLLVPSPYGAEKSTGGVGALVPRPVTVQDTTSEEIVVSTTGLQASRASRSCTAGHSTRSWTLHGLHRRSRSHALHVEEAAGHAPAMADSKPGSSCLRSDQVWPTGKSEEDLMSEAFQILDLDGTGEIHTNDALRGFMQSLGEHLTDDEIEEILSKAGLHCRTLSRCSQLKCEEFAQSMMTEAWCC